MPGVNGCYVVADDQGFLFTSFFLRLIPLFLISRSTILSFLSFPNLPFV